MPWWESSGAFALYGVLVGGVVASAVTALSNRHASALAKSQRESLTAEREGLAAEADRSRRHEIDLDRIRSVRTARQRVYPGMAEAIENDASHAIADAREALTGNRPMNGGNVRVLKAGKAGKAWARMMIFGTQRTIDEWERFLMAETALDAAIKALRIAQSDPPREGVMTRARAREEVTKGLNAVSETALLLYQHMREDLTSAEEPN